jgi:2-polyprenyl-6-hydroxyphenyl methylase/3-demethylubiquinone-9 3-methyltransferase
VPQAREKERFGFGDNWARFLTGLTDDRVEAAEHSFVEMMADALDEDGHLSGKSFLDVGSGSGLSSLVARRLGASVRSFDYDPVSVETTSALRQQYRPGDREWIVEQGSVLDDQYMRELGTYDIVHAWGVLHHTGALWRALEAVTDAVSDGGYLFVAVYNDQGRRSAFWRWMKRAYVRLPRTLRFLVVVPGIALLWGPSLVFGLLRGRPFEPWRDYGRERGMDPWHDALDWLGGYPFEVATPDEIFEFGRSHRFTLVRLHTRGREHGNNEFVFHKPGPDSA